MLAPAAHAGMGFLLSLALAGCGGGGGGDSAPPPTSNQPPPPSIPQVTPALAFTPGTASVTVEAGISATLSVKATAVRPEDITGPVYAMVVDTAGVIVPGIELSNVSPSEYTAILHTSPSLWQGAHKGGLTVKLCRDVSCSAQYPGSPIQLPYEITVVAPQALTLAAAPVTTLDATVHLGAAAPQLQVKVDAAALEWRASSTVAWAKVSGTVVRGSANLAVTIDPAGMPEGTHRGQIVIAAENQRVVLPVSLTLLASAFGSMGDGYAFASVNGAPIPPQTISIALDSAVNAPWTLASDSAWLSATPTAGTTPASSTLSIDPTQGKLASGTHNASLTLASSAGKTKVLPVQLTLTKPTLSTSASALTLGGPYGRDFTPVPVTVSLNTKANKWPWSVTAAPAWSSAAGAAPTVNESGTTLTLTPDESRIPLGSTTGSLALQAVVNGDTVTSVVPVTANRDQRKILPSITGVALVSTPGWSRLSRVVTVSDNFGRAATWSASSDKSWLNVTRSGASLSLTADPASLPADTISYATVSLQPADASVSAPEPIRVAFWKGSAAASPSQVLNRSYQFLIADPIRPLVYVNDGGSSIDVYNVYTAQKVATITAGTKLGEMSVSANGARLYVHDITGDALSVVDLATRTKTGSWKLDPEYPWHIYRGIRPLSVRPNGVEIVLTERGSFRASDGLRVSSFMFDDLDMASSPDSKRIYVQGRDIGPAPITTVELDYSAVGGGTMFAAPLLRESGRFGFGKDIAVGLDGTRVYTAASNPWYCGVLSADLSYIGVLPGGGHFTTNVEVDSFGRVYCGTRGASPDDMYIHDANGVLLKQFSVANPDSMALERQVAVSSDGMILVALTSAPQLKFFAVGPP